MASLLPEKLRQRHALEHVPQPLALPLGRVDDLLQAAATDVGRELVQKMKTPRYERALPNLPQVAA